MFLSRLRRGAHGTPLAKVAHMTRHSCLAVLVALALPALLTKPACAETAEESDVTTEDEQRLPSKPSVVPHVDARSSGESSHQQKTPHRRWYGDSILATDAAALALGFGAVAVSQSHGTNDLALPLALGGAFTYLTGGPIVHATHGRTGMAFGSLGVRVGIPLAGAGVGALVGSADEGDCSD